MKTPGQLFAEEHIGDTIRALEAMTADDRLLAAIDDVATSCVDSLRRGGKILFAGNGGSAADAQHLAGELVGRFAYDRPGLAAFALTSDSTVVTAIGNDYGYEKLFARQIEAVGTSGDVFFGISTSGRSPNVLNALGTARVKGLLTVGMTGSHGGSMASTCDYVLAVPARVTSRIQEGHILIGHIICELIEQRMFPQGTPSRPDE